jgi:hypothetical protein
MQCLGWYFLQSVIVSPQEPVDLHNEPTVIQFEWFPGHFVEDEVHYGLRGSF